MQIRAIWGMQLLDIFLSSISVNRNSCSAELTFELSDTFGVDETDVIKPLASFVAGMGVLSMWILQHRHGYLHLRVYLNLKLKSMVLSKKFIFVFYILIFFSCENDRKMVFHEKLNLPSDVYQTTKNYWDVYPVENLDVSDTDKVNEVSNFVLKKYSRNEAETCDTYRISFYVYNENGEDGINNVINYSKELIEWKGDYIRLEYNWIHGVFFGVTYFDDEGNVLSIYVRIKGFEKYMKVKEKTEKGFDEKGKTQLCKVS
ncbi:hypothetical protein [Flavobacterium cerinum]|uniref:Lipoprotein n=1 Tax=Flavobacterium cerinum TaxID=2502784 RepID=A0ABY5IVC2_9FLAO|nr:hypothetical protein [Flavobacterium cerinum]UUC46763.1 hypothetical protein NOX80_06065 [Flavobacterium cerinum]